MIDHNKICFGIFVDVLGVDRCNSAGQIDAELFFYSNHTLKETIKIFLYREQIQIRPLLCSA